MTKIVLDAESFKALASDTRLQIMKALDARPLTVSELSRALDLNKATVFEHLKQLTTADLVKREDDPARKWVYYRLTWKGRNILHPENAQIFLLLGMGALGMGGAVTQTVALLRSALASKSSAPEAGPDPVHSAALNMGPEAAQDSSGGSAPAQGQKADPNAEAAPPPDAAPEEPVSSDDGAWYDFFGRSDVLIALGLILFLLLVALLVWSLFSEQRKERERVGRMLDAALPANVNAAEERVV